MKKYILFSLLILTITASSYAQKNYATINAKLSCVDEKDSITLHVFKYKAFFHDADLITNYTSPVKGHEFSFHIPVNDDPQYIAVDFPPAKTEKSISSLLVEQGDSVELETTKDNYWFSGKGAYKYNVILRLRQIFNEKFRYYDSADPDEVLKNYENHDSVALAELNYLDSCRSVLTDKVYVLLKADIIGYGQSKGFTIFPFTVTAVIPFEKALKAYQKNSYLGKEAVGLLNDSTNLINSLGYCNSIIERYRIDSCYLKGKDFDITACYNYLRCHFRGNFRDGMITYLLFDRRRDTFDIGALTDKALDFVSDTTFREMLIKLKSSGLKGAVAYDFSLVDANDKSWSYHDFRGKVIVLDFWCRATAPVLEEIEKRFAGQSVIFISVSIDRHKKTWIKSLAEGKYCSNSSLNLFTGERGEDDPIIEHYHVAAFPTLILIDKQGRLTGGVGDIRYNNGKYLDSLISSAL
jgi:thiol-disulfide isomerase/thioredoxin